MSIDRNRTYTINGNVKAIIIGNGIWIAINIKCSGNIFCRTCQLCWRLTRNYRRQFCVVVNSGKCPGSYDAIFLQLDNGETSQLKILEDSESKQVYETTVVEEAPVVGDIDILTKITMTK